MPTRLSRRLMMLGCVFAYWTALFVLTHLPGNRVPLGKSGIRHADKLAHAIAFAGLAVLACAAAATFRPPTLAVYAGVAVVLAVYAVLDELTQGLIRSRTPDATDWLADMFGTSVGIVLFASGWLLLGRRAA